MSLRLALVVLLCGGLACGTKPAADAGPATNESPAELIAQADKLYAEREDLAHLRAAITALKHARAAEPGNYEAAWRLSRAEYFLGAHTSDTSERDKAFRDGAEAGKAAAQLQGNRPEGHFWLGANYGGSAQHSTLAGLSSVDSIIEEMEAVLHIDEGYESGSAYMALGQVYLESPKMFGGDQQKAVALLEKGLHVGENNALLRLRLAEAYVAVGRNDDARKQLDAIKSLKANPDYLPEYKDAVAEADKLRTRIP
jgi:tetratricopeptide (TPR) repeat protein